MSSLKMAIEFYNIGIVCCEYSKAISKTLEYGHYRHLQVVIRICGLYSPQPANHRLVVDAYAWKISPNISSDVQEIPFLNLNSSRSQASSKNYNQSNQSQSRSLNSNFKEEEDYRRSMEILREIVASLQARMNSYTSMPAVSPALSCMQGI